MFIVLGTEKVKYTNREQKEIEGFRIYGGYEKDGLEGYKPLQKPFWLSKRKYEEVTKRDGDITPGAFFDVVYDYRGNIRDLTLQPGAGDE